jgi:hypothetical protein
MTAVANRWLWLAAFLAVLVPGQLAVGMRASRLASVTGDEPFYLATAQSLVSDGDLDLRDEYANASVEMARFWDGAKPLWRQMSPAADGRLLAPHDPGLSLLIAPAYAVGGLEGVRRFLVVVWALAMAFAAVLARRLGVPWWAALVAAVAVGAGAPGLVYGSQVYPEAPAALLLCLGALTSVWRSHRAQTMLMLGLLVALEWLGVKYLPYAVLLGGVYVWRQRPDRRTLTIAGVIGGAAAIHFAWWHMRTFGSLTPYSTNLVWAGEGTSSIIADHLAMPDRAYRLYGLFLDARFGLFRWLPIAVLGLWGIGRRTLSVAATVAIGVLLGTFVSITIMGYWFPGRMLVAALPALVVLVAFGVARFPRIGVALAAWSVAIAVAVAVGAHTGAIRLAVDPWVVGFPLPPAPLFPDFRSFGAEQIAKSLAWALGLGALALLSHPGRRLRSSGDLPPPRRQLAGLPGVLRPTDRHGDGQRAGDERGVRVHQHARVPPP